MAVLTIDELLRAAPGEGPGMLASGAALEAPLVVARRGISAGASRAFETALFDLASLTKPFVASLALVLDERGLLPLATPLGDLVMGCDGRLARRSLDDLLRHRAGLQPWTPLFARLGAPHEAIALLVGGRLLGAPVPTYSDLGYVLYGQLAATACQRSLEALLDVHLSRPLGLRVRASPGRVDDVVPCALDNRREVELASQQGIRLSPARATFRGVPQDANARWLGGLSGHAGLFGTAADLWKLAREWLDPQRVLSPVAVQRALRGRNRLALGWWRRRVRNSAGPGLSSAAFGHVGFTGGSVWADPRGPLICVSLLCRNVEADLGPWRRQFHSWSVECSACEAASGRLQSE